MAKQQLITQTENAFDFIQKLYYESSYLIKELEGLLGEEDEEFVIGKPSGYGIIAKSSGGLESDNVRLWLLRKYAVFFAPAARVRRSGGKTITSVDGDLKVIYVRIIFDNKDIAQPKIHTGVLKDLAIKKDSWNKFENLMSHFEYNDNKIFKDISDINYEDAYFQMKGRLIENNLYEINDSKTIMIKIVNPTLNLYRN